MSRAEPLITYDLVTEESAIDGDVAERGTVHLFFREAFIEPMDPEIIGEQAKAYLEDKTTDTMDCIRWMRNRSSWRDSGNGSYYDETEERTDEGVVTYAVHFGRSRTNLLKMAGVNIEKG
jgi:hypothetical protein